MRFKNPQNGYVEEGWTSISWLWCFLLGPLYLAGRGLWGPAVISFFLNAAAYSVLSHVEGLGLFLLCAVNFFFAARVQEMMTSYYMRKGWLEVEEKKEEKNTESADIAMDRADIALSVMQKVDNEQEEQPDKFIEGCRKHLL